MKAFIADPSTLPPVSLSPSEMEALQGGFTMRELWDTLVLSPEAYIDKYGKAISL